MIVLSQYKNLPVEKFASVFNDTTNSYKFYWFLSILDELTENKKTQIPIKALNERMFEYVWYPIEYFRLSFGKSDGFIKIFNFIKQSGITPDYTGDPENLISQIRQDPVNNPVINELERKIDHLARWVPYRFLRPFFFDETRGLKDSSVNSIIRELANNKSSIEPEYVPYCFSGSDCIVINDIWADYFIENVGILKSFTLWHLNKFMQSKNPNVPGICDKLFRPSQRNLYRYTSAWKIFASTNNLKCLYSGQTINDAFTLDHFIPWSFVTHDLNWNLVPALKESNISKGNRLPSLRMYLEPFSDLQYTFFKTFYQANPRNQVLEEYCILFNSNLEDINLIAPDDFKHKIYTTISTMEQIAANMGFLSGWYYQSV